MNIRKIGKLAGRLGVITAITVGVSIPMSVTAANANPGLTTSGPICVTVVDKIRAGQQSSTILGRACAHNIDDARAQLPSADYLLAVFYQHIDFKGKMDYAYGGEPCDGDGYGLSDLSSMQARVSGMSSFALHSGCNRAEAYLNTGFGGRCNRWEYSPVRWVGSRCDNLIRSMRIWKL